MTAPEVPEENPYVAMVIFDHDTSDILIWGIYRTKKSAAEELFERFSDGLTTDPDPDSDSETFWTKEGDFSKSGFIQHLIDEGSLQVDDDVNYEIHQSEQDVKP